jgi:primosomal protein N''
VDAIKKIEKLEARLQDVERERNEALARIDVLERRLKELGVNTKTLRPDTDVNLGGMSSQQLKDYVTVLRRMVQDDQVRIAELEKQLKGGKAPGYPICTVTSGYLLSFTLLEDGRITGAPAWDSAAGPIVGKIDGVSTLASGRALTIAEFRSAARKIQDWEGRQTQQCRFRVKALRLTSSAAVYDKQLDALGYFYPKRVTGGP